jgi:hypothetical protein
VVCCSSSVFKVIILAFNVAAYLCPVSAQLSSVIIKLPNTRKPEKYISALFPKQQEVFTFVGIGIELPHKPVKEYHKICCAVLLALRKHINCNDASSRAC